MHLSPFPQVREIDELPDDKEKLKQQVEELTLSLETEKRARVIMLFYSILIL